MSTKKKLATVWLDGCSGCHMSFLDQDERLLDVAAVADLVYSPVVDPKEFPEAVDVCLVEGAVSTTDDLEKIRKIRERTTTLVSFGDCAVTTNVTGLRNPLGPDRIYEVAFETNTTLPDRPAPTKLVPEHLPKALPVHKVVHIDVFLPGCPPSADLIHATLMDLLAWGGEGPAPDPMRGRFGLVTTPGGADAPASQRSAK